MLARLLAATVVVIALAGCAPAPAALPHDVTVSVFQNRFDYSARKLQLKVTNGTDTALTVTRATFQSTRFVEPAVWDRPQRIPAGGARDLSVQLPSDADSVVVSITDKNGKVVRTMNVGPRSEGKSALEFDGLDQQGNPLPAGEYSMKVVAAKNEVPVTAGILERGAVSGVSFVDGVAQLLVNGRKVSLPDVLEINERGTA